MTVRPFTVRVADDALVDLDVRLGATRFPYSIDGSGWSYGTDVEYLRELVDYWTGSFDWREIERQINAVPQFRAEISGVDLHFAHIEGKGPAPIPLLFSHGWPGSFWEVSKIIGPLTDPVAHGGDPADAFTVVAPSLPGFGFSSDIGRPGMHPGAMADILARLMSEELGYSRFLGQGGDWGSTVLTRLAHAAPEKLVGLHLNYSSVQPQLDGARPLTLRERKFLEDHRAWNAQEGAYNQVQATKPQSIGVGLNDSPAGLAAWLVEKYRTWSDCGGDVENVFSKDELLTQVMIYWVTGTIASSMRLYAERARESWELGADAFIDVPTAYACFPAEIRQPPREWLERIFRIEQFTDMPRGGHFAALEVPDLLVEDIRRFARPLRARPHDGTTADSYPSPPPRDAPQAEAHNQTEIAE